jgi:hypothetical protein
MPRLDTQEIVNGAITTALDAAAKGQDTMAIVRGLEAVAHALVGVERAINDQSKSMSPALNQVVSELAGIATSSQIGATR